MAGGDRAETGSDGAGDDRIGGSEQDETESDRGGPGGVVSPRLYAREVRMSLRNNSGAFGYSVMITCSLSMNSAVHSAPSPWEVLLFALGAVGSFLIIEIAATNFFRRSLGGDEPSNVVALGSSISVFSVSSAVGVTVVTATLLPATLSWLVGSFAASVTYLVVNAVEMSVARRVEEKRDLA